MGIVTSVEKYYEDAKEMLEKKDLAGFMECIGSAKILAGTDKNLLAKVTYLKVEGLYSFNQFKSVKNAVAEALQYNKGDEAFRLKEYKGIALGYLGEIERALKIFKALINESENNFLLTRIYINISWVHLTLDKSRTNLDDAKKCLDLAKENFEDLPNRLKIQIHNNYSVYYFYKEDYEKAVDIINNSLEYCEEQDLPGLYNNLAEIYLKYGKGSLELVKEFSDKAEIIANKYNNQLELGKAFYTKAMAEIEDEDLFTALDTLYLSFEYFKEAEAYPYAFDSLVKINELMNNYKIDYLKSIKGSLQGKLNGAEFFKKI